MYPTKRGGSAGGNPAYTLDEAVEVSEGGGGFRQVAMGVKGGMLVEEQFLSVILVLTGGDGNISFGLFVGFGNTQ